MITEAVQRLESLPDNLQQQALDFIRSLSASLQQGVPGQALQRFAGFIPADELALMNQAIEKDCEQVEMG